MKSTGSFAGPEVAAVAEDTLIVAPATKALAISILKRRFIVGFSCS
jgi:hypothetical protein